MVMAGLAAAVGIAAPQCGPAFAQGKAVKPRSVVQKPVSPALKKEMTEQTEIYQTRGEQIPVGYVIDRSLLSYATTLLPGFGRSLADLSPADRWLDIGAGQGRAIQHYYGSRYDAMHPEGAKQRGTKAQAIAMSIEDRRTAEWYQTAASLEPGKIRYLSGRRLREYTQEELGRFKLVTDVYGGFSYTSQLALFMEDILAVLEVNGSFYTLLINVDPEHWPSRSALPRSGFQTEIIEADGAVVKVCAWLKRISCVEVVCEVDERSTTPIERYQVKKTCNNVAVPALELISFSAGTPPARQFQLIDPLPAAPPPSGVAN